MTNPGPTRGWKVRRDKRNAKAQAELDQADVRAIHAARREAERLALAAAELEAAKLRERIRCSCPVCDGAPVDVDLAARVITAMQRLPAHVVNDPNVVAALNAVISSGREIPRASIYSDAHRGMHVPHRMYAPAPVEYASTITVNSRDEVAAAVVEAMTKHEPATVTPKSEPVIPSKRRPSIAELAVRGDADDQGD